MFGQRPSWTSTRGCGLGPGYRSGVAYKYQLTVVARFGRCKIVQTSHRPKRGGLFFPPPSMLETIFHQVEAGTERKVTDRDYFGIKFLAPNICCQSKKSRRWNGAACCCCSCRLVVICFKTALRPPTLALVVLSNHPSNHWSPVLVPAAAYDNALCQCQIGRKICGRYYRRESVSGKFAQTGVRSW